VKSFEIKTPNEQNIQQAFSNLTNLLDLFFRERVAIGEKIKYLSKTQDTEKKIVKILIISIIR